MQWRALALASLTLASAAVQPAIAYDPETHRTISVQAMLLLMSCRPDAPGPGAMSAFAQGAFDEDETERMTSRAWNWHFHNVDQRNPPPTFAFGVFNTTLDIVLGRRNKDMETALAATPFDERAAWHAAGRVGHYIEDMSVPAHAVPIYHAPLPLPGLNIKDTFDSYAETHFGVDGPAIARDCASIGTATSASAKDFVDAAAKHTRDAIKAPIDTGKRTRADAKLRWDEVFWRAEPKSAYLTGFGSYGPEGSEAWGSLDPIKCYEGETCTIPVAEYETFFKARYREAVANTAQWILYVQARIKARKAAPR